MSDQVLDDGERAALAAVLAVILPSTSGPGATEARAADHACARLEGPLAHRLDDLRPVLARAAEDPEGTVADLADAGDPRFEELRSLAWEGFLCDPARGGNQEGVGWARFGTGPRRKARR